jgi:chromosome segregation and condensation protein ScpB
LTLTRNENFVVAAIAYLQPVTRAELSGLAGREIGRDVLARLKQLGLIAAGPRTPAPGAPLTYVTTAKFLSVFGLGSLRDLPEREAIEDAGLLKRRFADAPEDPLDAVIGFGADAHRFVEDSEGEEADEAPLAGD